MCVFVCSLTTQVVVFFFLNFIYLAALVLVVAHGIFHLHCSLQGVLFVFF